MAFERSRNKPKSFDDLPEGSGFHRLFYSRPADMLVASIGEELPNLRRASRLWFRPVTSELYRRVPVENPLDIHQSAACCQFAPFVLFNVQRARLPDPDQPEIPPDWTSIQRFNLTTGVVETVLTEERLRSTPPYASVSVTEILSAWPDGSGAVCKVAMYKPDDWGGPRLLQHFVYEVSFAHGLGREIASLPRETC